MDAFITSYIATVTSDPRAAFDQLTPEFQEASGGYEGYMRWWGKVRSAELADVSSDPSDLTVGYTVDYVMKTGKKITQSVRLQLQRLDDQYLIAGEGARPSRVSRRGRAVPPTRAAWVRSAPPGAGTPAASLHIAVVVLVPTGVRRSSDT